MFPSPFLLKPPRTILLTNYSPNSVNNVCYPSYLELNHKPNKNSLSIFGIPFKCKPNSLGSKILNKEFGIISSIPAIKLFIYSSITVVIFILQTCLIYSSLFSSVTKIFFPYGTSSKFFTIPNLPIPILKLQFNYLPKI